MPKLLFVGAGNIAQSIMRGILRAQYVAADQILATAPTNRNLNVIKEKLGCRTILLNNVHTSTLAEFHPDFVFFCVKPQVLLSSLSKKDTLTQLLSYIPHRCITLSLAAGIKSRTLAGSFNRPPQNIVRLMVNTAAEINATSVFYYTHPEIEPDDHSNLKRLLNMIGQPVVSLADENLMDVATGVCGSGIAFFYETIQAIGDISVKNGLRRDQATQVAAQLAKAAGEMVLTKQAHPYQLRDEVTSPAGTTIYGLHRWHEQSASQRIALAFQASIDRAKELSSVSESRLDDLTTETL